MVRKLNMLTSPKNKLVYFPLKRKFYRQTVFFIDETKNITKPRVGS